MSKVDYILKLLRFKNLTNGGLSSKRRQLFISVTELSSSELGDSGTWCGWCLTMLASSLQLQKQTMVRLPGLLFRGVYFCCTPVGTDVKYKYWNICIGERERNTYPMLIWGKAWMGRRPRLDGMVCATCWCSTRNRISCILVFFPEMTLFCRLPPEQIICSILIGAGWVPA